MDKITEKHNWRVLTCDDATRMGFIGSHRLSRCREFLQKNNVPMIRMVKNKWMWDREAWEKRLDAQYAGEDNG